MPDADLNGHVAAVRRFSRFYTAKLGILQEGLLRSPFSLTEARVLFELANRERSTAREVSDSLGLDPGYLSRILSRFVRQGLLKKRHDARDGRQSHLMLTDAGRRAFAELDARSRAEVAALLAKLPAAEQGRLVGAMQAIEEVLASPSAPAREPYLLRSPRAGDIGWVIQRHGALYAHEYGWDEQFEALVAEIAARFLQQFDPKREACWIAERDGKNVGCVFLVRHSDTVAKLRLLLVEPGARGLGIGRRLVEECVRFARQSGYGKLVLWTNDVLLAARYIYTAAGFHLVSIEPHHSFGRDLIGETWALDL